MDMSQLNQAVIDQTNRPERAAQIQLALAKAILKAHNVNFWNRDIVEKKVVTAISQDFAPRYEIAISTEFPRWRKFAYIKAWDPVSKVEGGCFDEESPLGQVDGYGYFKNMVYYAAGDQLVLRTVKGITGLIVGFWSYPDISAGNFISWIMDLYPNILIDEASVDIFGAVGDFDEANRRKGMWKDNLAILTTNDIEAQGR